MKIALMNTLVFLAFAALSGAAAEDGVFKQLLSSNYEYVAAETASVSSDKKKKHDDGNNGGKMGTQIIIHGCVNDPSEQHGPVLAQCFVDSYGTQLGFTIKEAKITKEVDVPDKTVDAEKSSSFEQYLWGYAIYSGCGDDCPDDENSWFPDDLPPSAVTSSEVFEAHLTHPSAAKIHAQFEEAFCTCLTKGGLKTYKKAYGCDIKYAYFSDNVGMEPFEESSDEIEE